MKLQHFAQVAVLLFSAAACQEGSLTESLESVADRDLSALSRPSDPAAMRPVDRVPRAIFGTANDETALAYPNLTADELATFRSAIAFFTTEHTPDEGIGPVFNQRRCLGCHMNSSDVGSAALSPNPPSLPNVVNTPVSRASRQAKTDYAFVSKTTPPPTAAFTLFGDFNEASGVFDPLTIFGGPIQHVRAPAGCEIDIMPAPQIDPNLRGGVDPITGLSELGNRREVGERAAPAYIGRGLMEAIYPDEIVANEDDDDLAGATTSLEPQPDTTACVTDCISGRHNENHSDTAFVGGDPLERLSRFGLRAAGPTILQFVVGGTQGELGMTSPFAPTEQNNPWNVGRLCENAPDPEMTADQVLQLRTLIRLLGVPEFAPELLESPPSTDLARDVQAGATLFGVDLEAFGSRMTPGATPVRLGDFDADRGIAADRKLNCVGCHIPIMRTGGSPARLGAEHLSNRWAPLFSDLLIHKMTSYPLGRKNQLNPPPPPGLDRNLADFALPNQGLANGDEWRTPTLMGIGKVAAPFLHDARVFLRPEAPASTVYTSAAAKNEPLTVDNLDHALQAAIELHDLPAPPANDVTQCPPVLDRIDDICGRASAHRSEARNVIEKWHNLSDLEQRQVLQFLKAL